MSRWFRDLLSLDPEMATFVGVHDHDRRLSEGGPSGVEAELAFHRASAAEMERIDPGELSSERALDRDLVIHESRLAAFQLAERRAWAGATNAAEHIGNALFPLFTRDFAPLAERMEAIAARLDDAPRFLAASRDQVERPVRLWIEIDLESTTSLHDFLDAILAAARAERVPGATLAGLESAVERVRVALHEHAAWLHRDALPRSDGQWAAGGDLLEELIRLRALEATGDEILAVGERILAEEKAARDEVCAEIDPTMAPEDVADLVKDDHPATFPEALDAYRRAMDRARAFAVENDLVTMPPNERLRVIETPPYDRHLIPFAAYYDPARFDPDSAGTYIVTPPADEAMWREHNYAAISNTSVHEAYPGHHVQLAGAITNPSLVRTLALSAAEFVEGWAFYCERMMKEAGFDATPSHRYVQHTDAIWRAARIILDIRLHRGEIGFQDAVRFLREQTGFEEAGAVAEVKRYTSTPTYQLSYMYGRHMIDALRDRVERRMGPAFTPKFFHDTLIYGGTMPVSYASRLFERKLGSLDR